VAARAEKRNELNTYSTMATFLFWNTYKKPLKDEIVELCKEHFVDILILAESKVNDAELLISLNEKASNMFCCPPNSSSRLKFFVRYPLSCFTPIMDAGGVSARKLSLPLGQEIILIAVHLPSNLYGSDFDPAMVGADLSRTITEIEKERGHERTLIVGDINMNPFDDGVVAASGLHGVMEKQIARKIKRTTRGQEKKFFYNPMWALMGQNFPRPAGTYYYEKSGEVTYFWNTFDQVLLRPELIDIFSEKSLRIIANTKTRSFVNKTGLPDKENFSDHLPILFSLQIERGEKWKDKTLGANSLKAR
jgi:hypothetical protein